ncbi:hypothetical protein GCM10027416_28450 [Okibacterium endophyticum]
MKIVFWLSRVLAILSALSIVVLMLAITADVIARYASEASIPGLLELAESSLVVAVFFGLAWAGVQGEHVAVTLLADRLGERTNRVFDIVVWALATAFLVWFLCAVVERAISSTRAGEQRFGLMQWPLYPLRWAIAIGIGAFLIVAIANLVRSIAGRRPVGGSTDAATAELPSNDPGPHAAESAESRAAESTTASTTESRSS